MQGIQATLLRVKQVHFGAYEPYIYVSFPQKVKYKPLKFLACSQTSLEDLKRNCALLTDPFSPLKLPLPLIITKTCILPCSKQGAVTLELTYFLSFRKKFL